MTMTSTSLPANRFNFRVLILLAVVLAPVGFVLYQFLRPNVIDRGGFKDVDLRWLSDFEVDQQLATDADIPADRRALDGKRVLLRGEMYKPDAWQGPVKHFTLVFSITKCCVTSAPKIQHFVRSTVVDGGSGNAYPDQAVEVMGTLHVGVQRDKDSGKILSIYRLDVESVKELKAGFGTLLWIGGAFGVVLLGGGVVWLIRSRRAASRGW